jgi:hypothetical protein
MPDYVVLISTLGGLATVGLNGLSSARLSRSCSSPLGTFFSRLPLVRRLGVADFLIS